MRAGRSPTPSGSSRSHNLTRFITAQNQYNLLDRSVEKELAPACQKFGVGILPYFPLASGFLTGKYRRGSPPPEGTRLAVWGRRGEAIMSDDNFSILDKLEGFASEHGKTMLDLAFGWLLSHDYVPSVIAGATTPEQIEANVAAGEWRLSAEELAQVDALLEGDGNP